MATSSLDEIIREVAQRVVYDTTALAAQKWAEEMARDALSDQQARQEMRELVRAAVHRAFERLAREPDSGTTPSS